MMTSSPHSTRYDGRDVGTQGYKLAAGVAYTPDSVILEVGVERDSDGTGSTTFLASVGPRVFVIDVDEEQFKRACSIDNVVPLLGLAESVLRTWTVPIGFAWLDGHDWPYEHAPAGMWDAQEREYHERHQAYSRDASRASHLTIAKLIAPHVIPGGVVAFDDTWRLPSVLDPTPGPGWNGKGGAAVPYLLEQGFTIINSGDIHHGHVVMLKS